MKIMTKGLWQPELIEFIHLWIPSITIKFIATILLNLSQSLRLSSF